MHALLLGDVKYSLAVTHCSFLCRAAVVALQVQAHGDAGLETTVQGLPYCLVGDAYLRP